MSAIGNTNSSSAASNTSSSSQTQDNDLRQLDLNGFLKLLISELQNQDPLNPMDNSQMVQQLATIREIGATNELSESLTGFSITQQLSTASSLMGQTVNGLSDSGEEVSGKVDRVSVETSGTDVNARIIKVHVGTNTMEVKNIRDIRPAAA